MSTGLIANKHLLSTQSADVLFLYQLLQAGLPEAALSLAEMFPSDPALMFLLGSIYLDLGRTEDAKDAFDSASSALGERNTLIALCFWPLTHAGIIDDEDEMTLLPSEARTPEKYYYHVAELFYQQAADSETLHFCCLSISHFSSETDQGFKREVTHRAFQSAVKLALFERAYSILIALPTSELYAAVLCRLNTANHYISQNDCLRTLISHMSEAGQVDLLLRLPFIGLRNELESQLEFRSRNEDPRSPLCFAKFLYSYYLSRSDYRKGDSSLSFCSFPLLSIQCISRRSNVPARTTSGRSCVSLGRCIRPCPSAMSGISGSYQYTISRRGTTRLDYCNAFVVPSE